MYDGAGGGGGVGCGSLSGGGSLLGGGVGVGSSGEVNNWLRQSSLKKTTKEVSCNSLHVPCETYGAGKAG